MKIPLLDNLIPEAKRVILSEGKAAASLLQRKLKIGYAASAYLLDKLEEEGFVSASEPPNFMRKINPLPQREK